MPDTQIHPLGTVIAPGDFTIPGSAELKLKGVYASFDGSGAASSFIPLVRFISDAGSVALEAVADTTIAAGGSADASWFPRVAAAAATATTTGTAYATANGEDAAFTTGPPYSKISLTPGTLLTNDSSIFSVASSFGINGIQIAAAGTYEVWVGAIGFPAGAVAANSVLGVGAGGLGAVNFLSPVEQVPFELRADSASDIQANAAQGYIVEIGIPANPVGTIITAEVGQNTGGDVDVEVFVSVKQLDATNP